MIYILTITCVCQSTWTLSQWSTVRPHCHWPNWRARGGTRANTVCDWTRGAWLKQVQEACFKFPSWMGKIQKCLLYLWQAAGSEVKPRTTVRMTWIWMQLISVFITKQQTFVLFVGCSSTAPPTSFHSLFPGCSIDCCDDWKLLFLMANVDSCYVIWPPLQCILLTLAFSAF